MRRGSRTSPLVAGQVRLRAAGEGEQFVGGGREHVVRLPRGGVDRFEPAKGAVEVDRHPVGQRHRGNGAYREPRARHDVFRPRQPHPLPVSQRTDLLRVHPAVPGDHDRHRRFAGQQQDRLRDLAHLDSERPGGELRVVGRLLEAVDLLVEPRRLEERPHLVLAARPHLSPLPEKFPPL